MAMTDIFNSNIFGLTQMTAAITQLPYVPTMLGDLGIFEEEGIPTTMAVIEFLKGELTIIPVTARNAPAASISKDKRTAFPILVPHVPVSDGLLADALQNRRAFGTDGQVDTIEAARNRQLTKMRASLDYTIEAHRLSAIKGLLYDASGGTTDLFAYFGVTQVVVPMNLDVATTRTRAKVLTVQTAIEDALAGTAYQDVIVLCGKNFWADLVEHPTVKDTFAKALDGAALRADPRLNLTYGGAVFVRYRGNSLVKVGDDEAYAIPRGVAGLALTRFAPANYIETVNTTGIPYYSKAEPMPMGKGVTMESQTNPLNIVTRPNAIVKLLKNS